MQLPVVSLCQIVKVMRCLYGFFVQGIAYFVMSFNIPLISNHLDSKGYSSIFMSVGMTAAAVSYVISMPIVSCLRKRISKKGIMFIGLSLQTTGVLISGIDQIREWYNPGIFTLIGICAVGLGSGITLIPIMPEILEGIESDKQFKGGYDEFQLQNNLAGYFICCQAIGETLGPFTSSLLERGIDFRPTQKALAILVTCFLISYLLACGVYGFFKLVPH